MFEELDELKAHLDNLRPIDPDKMSAIQEKLRIDWTYNSNAIEGNTLTLQETAFFLREGLTSKGKPLSEFLEAKNHVEAISFLEEVVRDKRPLTERLIKDFHAIVMHDNKYIWVGPAENRVRKEIEPGSYKKDNNHVVKLDGTIHFYTEYLQVPGEMERFVHWYEENFGKMHPVELSARLHHGLVAIHPFTDGNGRVARLVMNMVLMQAGYVPAIIRNEDRMEYYAALDSADKGDYAPFIGIVEREAFRTIKMVVDVIEGREAFGKEDLKRMAKGLAEKIGKLDKDIGIVSKEIDIKTQEEIVANICSFITNLANSIASYAKQEELAYKITQGTSNVAGVMNRVITIELIKARKYIPKALCYFRVVPKGNYCELSSMMSIYQLDGAGETLRNDYTNNQVITSNVDIGSGDYDKAVVESFFIDSLKVFLKAIDSEIENRRRTISEQNHG